MSTVVTSTPAAIGANDQRLVAGDRVGDYEVEAVIGKGGFGTVYRAHHPVIGKLVAVKVLARRYAADPEIVSRFVSEARAVNQIRHRHIIDIFSFGQLEDGRHYYVMELLDGEPLDQRLARCGPLPLGEALPILRPLALALDTAHAKGIAHRDLKPENIFLATDPEGQTFPKLLDFGIAKLLVPEDDVVHRTGTGVPIGTPHYMSPEQCRGRDVDQRTDIYSFGVVVYRMLVGECPFEGSDYMELMMKHMSDEPPRPSARRATLPAAVDDAVAWMMSKDPERRPPSLAVAVAALDPSARWPAPRTSVSQGNLSNLAGTAETLPSLPPLRPRRRWPWLAVVPVVAIGGTAAYFVTAATTSTAVVTPLAAAPPRDAPPPPDAPAPDPPVLPTVATPPPVTPPTAGQQHHKPAPRTVKTPARVTPPPPRDERNEILPFPPEKNP